MRLFVALHLDPSLRETLVRLQSDLRALDRDHRVRWVDPYGIHLTLAFLGEVTDDRRDPIASALSAATRGRIAPRLGLGGLGAFPNRHRARVLWAGLREEDAHLGQLHAAVTASLAPLGFEPEVRAFQPHLTLGRVREGPAHRSLPLEPDLLRALETTPADAAPPVPHHHLALVRSHLSPTGARYEDLKSYRLQVA